MSDIPKDGQIYLTKDADGISKWAVRLNGDLYVKIAHSDKNPNSCACPEIPLEEQWVKVEDGNT